LLTYIAYDDINGAQQQWKRKVKMESRKAKKIAAANGAELVYNKDAKHWNLTIVGTSVSDALDSKMLKGYDDEELIDEIEGLKVATAEPVEAIAAPKTRKRKYPVGIAWSKGTTGSKHGGRAPTAVAVTLPDGSEVVGSYEPIRGKYFFFADPDTGNAMGGRAVDFVTKNEDGNLVVDLTA
jgi:hypothetical protein